MTVVMSVQKDLDKEFELQECFTAANNMNVILQGVKEYSIDLYKKIEFELESTLHKYFNKLPTEQNKLIHNINKFITITPANIKYYEQYVLQEPHKSLCYEVYCYHKKLLGIDNSNIID